MAKELPDVNDYAAAHGPDGLAAEIRRQSEAAEFAAVRVVTDCIRVTPDQYNAFNPIDRAALERAADLVYAAFDGSGAKALGIQQNTCVKTVSEYLAIDTENDPSCLLGKRWICRGGSFIFNAHAGAGKSSLLAQMMVSFALDMPFFGITPQGPLKSIVVQAENDDGDIAEQLRGIINGMNLGSRVPELNTKIIIVPNSSVTGDEFVKLAEQLALVHRPDLFFIDPLFSFLGGDVSDQKTVSKFLRNGLNPLSQKYGFAWGVVHHTNKPSKDPKQKAAPQSSADFSYQSSGSSELVNWPRAVIGLKEIDSDSGQYQLKLGKRGKRAGLKTTDAPEAPTTMQCSIQHSERGIFWERSNYSVPEVLSGIKPSITIDQVIEALRGLKPQNKDVLIRKIAEKAKQGEKRARVAFDEADQEKLLKKIEEFNPKGGSKIFYQLDSAAADVWQKNEESDSETESND